MPDETLPPPVYEDGGPSEFQTVTSYKLFGRLDEAEAREFGALKKKE